MSLENAGALCHITAWLTSCELRQIRALNSNLRTSIPKHTWELTACNISSTKSMVQLSTIFPNVWCLRVQDAVLEEIPTMESLVPWLDNRWRLRELTLTRVTCMNGFDLHLLAEKLTKVTICECYQVHELAIVAPNLEALTIKHCPMTRFHADSRLPQLKSLSLSSRSLRAVQARHLLSEMLPGSPALETLALCGCSQLNEVLVNANELPALRQLDVSSCARLARVHVTSKVLQSLDLSHNDELQYLFLDVDHAVDLDLSFLKSLTHLDIRSRSLRRLNLRGCSQLTQTATNLNCPNLQRVILHGTSIVADDLNARPNVDSD
ncbi:unnamed protein product [Hyaloperonospora brassicae]|uniref:F-box domain-containing protein n=1 Tax=Hyaloperonospora brassicae TaxID=162125 RepID=A0AAV0TRG9_HYABA|nr:unnamed protein product [Hyaloperonospora brassicae]